MIRVATINTWKGDGDYGRRLALLAGNLKEENIDILCCQESFRTLNGEYDTARTLATELGMTCSFSAARKKRRVFQGKKIESVSGQAILTGPETWMLYSGSFPLPGNSRDKGRVAQFAVIRKDGDAVLVVNLHLSHLQGAGRLRRQQLQTVLSHPIMEKQFAAILFCGDFNAISEDEELTYLKKQSEYKVSDGFIAGGGNAGVSTLVPEKDGRRKKKKRRIDHIFVFEKNRRPSANLKLSNSRLILNHPGADGVLPSDHFGVALDLTLSRVNTNETSQVCRYVSFTTPAWRRSREGELDCSF